MKYPGDYINKVILGDCMVILPQLPDNSVHSMLTDPPAGISFMSKEFDTFKSLMAFQDFICAFATEAIRVLKPGAHALVWAIPRTSHHTAMGLERAGFEIRDVITHLYGSGFPKSENISLALDKKECLKLLIDKLKRKPTKDEFKKSWESFRKVVGVNKGGGMSVDKGHVFRDDNWMPESRDLPITEPVSGNAKKWEGWGTALKPASEHWILCRKPMEKGLTIAENILKWGVGGINIDDCRIGYGNETDKRIGTNFISRNGDANNNANDNQVPNKYYVQMYKNSGRFPANLILECTCDEVMIGQASGSPGHWGKTKVTGFGKFGGGKSVYKGTGPKDDMKCLIHTNPSCPCYILDKQSGKLKSGDNCIRRQEGHFGEHGLGKSGDIQTTYGDMGGASRFFYTAKASQFERDYGCGNLPGKNISINMPHNSKNLNERYSMRSRNFHPTVKPLSLIKYLINLITPEHGIVVDPFGGSGTVGVAAKDTGHDFIIIEKDPEYHKISVARTNATERNLF